MPGASPSINSSDHDIALTDSRRLSLQMQLGRGGVATVYRGVLTNSWNVKRAVAVKVFDVLSSDEQDLVISTLARAAEMAACVRHPNVVELYEFGVLAPAQPFMVVELVEGRTLATLIEAYRRNNLRMPLDLALFIGIEMADALNGARLACTPEGVQIGLCHGELSPCDALLSWNGEVKVADFGIAAAARAASSVRSVRALASRIRALAPEVARGNMGDARSDVFSLGVVLREMLVGPRFAPQITDQEALKQARDGVFHTAVFEPQLAPELRQILGRALEREPSRRFPHAGALSYELRRIAMGMGVGDGRAFLRHAMPKVFAMSANDDEITDERPRPAALKQQCASGDTDRFARLRGDRDSGTVRSRPRPFSPVLSAPAANDEDED